MTVGNWLLVAYVLGSVTTLACVYLRRLSLDRRAGDDWQRGRG
jgi:hypothetical protein